MSQKKRQQDRSKNTAHQPVEIKLLTKDGKRIYLRNSEGKYTPNQLIEMTKDTFKDILSTTLTSALQKLLR